MGRLTSPCVALALVSTLTVTIAGAAFTSVGAQDTGQLAYTGPGGSLCLTDAAGEETVQLVGPQGFAAAQWSPDAERLVLVKGGLPWAEGNEIFVVNADGTGLTKVADGYTPVWSQDSQQFFYVSNFSSTEEGTEQSLKAISLQDGADSTVVTRRWISGLWPIERLWYSPQTDMMAVYVAGLEMEGHVVILGGEGSVLWEIADYVYSADNFAWSPDGRSVVYRDSGDPFIGGKDPALKIFRVKDQELASSLPQAGFWPRWSPDGKKIATFVPQEGGDFSVTILSADGKELVAQPDHTFGDIWNSRPYWSPDSSQLLVASLEDDETRIYVMDEAGGLRAIAEGKQAEASWSPDGTQVALALGVEGSREIYVVKGDGSDLRKIADGWAPRWRPAVTAAEPGAPYCILPALGSFLTLGLAIMTSVRPQRARSRAGDA